MTTLDARQQVTLHKLYATEMITKSISAARHEIT